MIVSNISPTNQDHMRLKLTEMFDKLPYFTKNNELIEKIEHIHNQYILPNGEKYINGDFSVGYYDDYSLTLGEIAFLFDSYTVFYLLDKNSTNIYHFKYKDTMQLMIPIVKRIFERSPIGSNYHGFTKFIDWLHGDTSIDIDTLRKEIIYDYNLYRNINIKNKVINFESLETLAISSLMALININYTNTEMLCEIYGNSLQSIELLNPNELPIFYHDAKIQECNQQKDDIIKMIGLSPDFIMFGGNEIPEQYRIRSK